MPLSDWYEPISANMVGFQARPVVGGLFAPLVRRAGAFPNPNLTYRIVNQFNGLLVSVDNQSTANGAVITQWNDNGTPDHNWSFLGSGSYRLLNQHSNKVLTPLNWSTADGAGITQWDDNGTTDHLWQLLPNADGTYRIYNSMSGKVLTPTGWSTVLGNPLTQWDDNGTSDHNWSFWPTFGSVARPCDGLCANASVFTVPASTSLTSNNLGTGAVCMETTSVLHGGNCGNLTGGRTLSVNGTQETCDNGNWPSLPPARNGGYCVQLTAGNYAWAYFAVWN